MKKLILLVLMVQALIAQNVPFIMEHPVYHFLEKQESLGRINGEYWSTKPYTYTQIHDMLNEVKTHAGELTERELRILRRFQHELNRDLDEDEITFPWQKKKLKALLKPDSDAVKPLAFTYKQDEVEGWISVEQTYRIQANDKGSRGYHTDNIAIFGQRDKIDFSTQVFLHRVDKSAEFETFPETYRGEFYLERDHIPFNFWMYPTSSLTLTYNDFTLGAYHQPVYWGYSPNNSSLLSNNVMQYPSFEWTTVFKHLRFKFLHARLDPNSGLSSDTMIVRRNLSAHRVEFDITPKFEFAYTEMVIYADRSFELAYLNPVNFLIAEEMSKDLDNKMGALDFKWLIRPGLTAYGSWLLDEFDAWRLFSGWWGNKFVFQTGLQYFPRINVPSLGIEFTAARPWTYSHSDPKWSYTSGDRSLGLKDGPNSQIIQLSSSWLVIPTLYLEASFTQITQGDDPGSDPLNSYLSRQQQDEEDQSFLLGELVQTEQMRLSGEYYINSVSQIVFTWVQNQVFEIGIQLNW